MRIARSLALVLLLVVVIAVLVACGGGGAQELLETAQLEETQNNRPHARELYRRLVDQYPGTPQAKQAALRLADLEQQP